MTRNNLIKNSTIYLSSTIINSGLVFFLTPIMAYLISPEEMGKVAIFHSLTVLLYSVVGLGSNSATVRFSYDVDSNKVGEYIGASSIILLFSVLGILAVLTFSSEYLSGWLEIKESWLYLSLLVATFNYFFLLLLGLCQRRGEAGKYAFLQIGNGLVNFILSILFIYSIYQSGDGRIYGWAVSIALSSVLSLYMLHEKYRVKINSNIKTGKELCQYGVPLIPHELGTFFITWLAMILVKDKLDLASVGIFLVSLQLSSILGVVCDAANKAYVPWLFERLNKKAANKVGIVKMTYITMLGLVSISILSFVLSPIIMPIFLPSEYGSVTDVFIVLVFGQALGGMYLLVTNYLFYSKKTKILPIITIISGLVNFILLIYLIDVFGLIGAAYAFTISRFVQFILTWVAAYFAYPMPWTLKIFGAKFGFKTD